MPGSQNQGWHQQQPQQFQGPPPPGHGPRPDNKGLRIGLVVLVGVLALACSGSMVIKAVDRLLTGISKGDFLRIAVGGSLAIGALTLLVGALMLAIGSAASRFVLGGAAALYLIAFLLRSIDGAFDGELLAALVGVLIAAAIPWLPLLAPHFQARKAPRQQPGWGPPPPGYGHQQMPQQGYGPPQGMPQGPPQGPPPQGLPPQGLPPQGMPPQGMPPQGPPPPGYGPQH